MTAVVTQRPGTLTAMAQALPPDERPPRPDGRAWCTAKSASVHGWCTQPVFRDGVCHAHMPKQMCTGTNALGKPCGNPALKEDDLCKTHRYGSQRRTKVELTAMCAARIERGAPAAAGLGWQYAAEARAIVKRKVFTERAWPERDENLAAAREWLRAHPHETPPWRVAEAAVGASDELDALVEQQAREARRDRFENAAGERPSRSPSAYPAISMDTPLTPQKDSYAGPQEWLTGHNFKAGGEYDDPLNVLIGASEQHLEEVLGDLLPEDVARLSDDELESLRQRILEAGLAPSSVQRKERERLRQAEPHRGTSPPPKRVAKSSRHRGRNEASDLHKQRGTKFNRRDTRRERQEARKRKTAAHEAELHDLGIAA